MGRNSYMFLSHILNCKTPSYGSRDSLDIKKITKVSEGSSINTSRWFFSINHLGTHVDMPSHFFDNGKTITDYDARFWVCTKIQLLDIPFKEAGLIIVSDLEGRLSFDTELLLIRTGYEKFRTTTKYWEDNPGVSATVGIWLRKNFPSVKMIGFDFISLTSWKFRDEGKRAHIAFLNPFEDRKPICIIEDMSLYQAPNHLNRVIISPLMVEEADGSPVTVFGY